jgi:hypothetical protein
MLKIHNAGAETLGIGKAVHLNPDKVKEGDAKDIDIQIRKVA